MEQEPGTQVSLKGEQFWVINLASDALGILSDASQGLHF